MEFTFTLVSVASLIAYEIPGYVLTKMGKIKESSIASFATVLMCLCQPCLCIYSLNKVDYTKALLTDMIAFFAIVLFLQFLMLMCAFSVLKKKGRKDAKYRIGAVATAFGNCGFFGVPLLEALLPERPEAVALATMFMISLNLLGWTLGSAIISMDKKYVSLKKAVFNPAIVGFAIGFIIFITSIELPDSLEEMITICGKMSTPMCMIIVGMRLATVPLKSVISSPFCFVIVAIKQIVFPLISLLIVSVLPVPEYMRTTLFILSASPVASIVLNFAEMLGEGQKVAANMVLIGTVMSIVTIPVMLLII